MALYPSIHFKIEDKILKRHKIVIFVKIDSQLLRCSTAWGSSTGSSLVGLAKVKVHKSFLFTEGSHVV